MSLDDHKEAIMAALATRRGRTTSLRDAEAAWTEIGKAVETANKAIKEFKTHASGDASGGRRRDQLESLVDMLTTAHKTLHSVQGDPYLAEPFGWAAGEPIGENDDGHYVDWDDVDEDLIHAVEYLGRLLTWAKQAQDGAVGSVIANRPPSPQTLVLSRLAFRLATIFAYQTDKIPGWSNGTPTPFENFMFAVTKATDFGDRNSEVARDAIKEAIRRLDAKRNRNSILAAIRPTERFRHIL